MRRFKHESRHERRRSAARSRRITSLWLAGVVLGLAGASRATAQAWYSGVPYLSWTDSPLLGDDFSRGYWVLEDFELGQVSAPGVSVSCGSIAEYRWSWAGCESVDEDDRALDGLGLATCWRAGRDCSEVVFTFDAAALGGQLPTHVGVVWTDVGASSLGFGSGLVQIEAYNADGTSLGTTALTLVGDSASDGATGEDRFFGTVQTGGVWQLAVRMPNSNEFSLDHLQFGLPVLCLADFNSDGYLTGDDFDAFLAAYIIGDESADFTRDGFVTGDDFDAYVAAFGRGC